jgi:hypothetical protein
MKPLTRKKLWSTVIPTAGFVLVLLAGPALTQGNRTKLVVLGAVVMGVAVFASALVWATGSADSDDHHRKP